MNLILRNIHTSIVVLNWNRCDDTLACLASMQTPSNCPTIYLVDNGSTDGTLDAVRNSFPSVEIVETGANLGYAGGNNVGICTALAEGADVIVILNNDTLVEPDCIEFLAHEASQPGIAAAAPKTLAAAAPGLVHFAGGVISGRGEPHHVGLGCTDGPEFDVPHDTEWVTGCAIAAHSSTFERVGLFDERFFLLFEDTDWSMRARRAGLRLRYVPAARIRHSGSVSFGGKASPAYRYYQARNHLLWLEKNYPAPLRWKLMVHSIRRSWQPADENTSAAPAKIPGVKAARLGVVHYFRRRFGVGPF